MERYDKILDPQGAIRALENAVIHKNKQLADAQATIAELMEALECVLTEKPLPNGEYVHLVSCNGDRRKPAGTVGVSCSCRVGRATIAALHDVIKQMGEQAAVIAKDAMAAKEQVAALQAERDEYKTMYACLTGETYDNPIADLKAQLTQRTAELEAAKAIQAIDLKNNNAYREQVANLQAELERVRGERDKLQSEVDGWELGSRGFP